MRLRSPLFILIILAFLSVFFLNTWQGFRYQELEREIGGLEQEQKNWLEKNKKVIAALAVLSSPERIKSLAEGSLGLKPLQVADRIEIELGGSRD
jgi:cell division protein FtsL